jgi:hypothetical protein
MGLVDDVQRGTKVTVCEQKGSFWLPTSEVLVVVGVAKNNQKFTILTDNGATWTADGYPSNGSGKRLMVSDSKTEWAAAEAYKESASWDRGFEQVQAAMRVLAGLDKEWLRRLKPDDKETYIRRCRKFILSLDDSLTACEAFGNFPLSSHLGESVPGGRL